MFVHRSDDIHATGNVIIEWHILLYLDILGYESFN